ncbi:hypothetical protein EYF80_058228 [Liparis tanakae]|uniref:Uncharacterized protein n=1 Tax=Liparis tanakae TaxID=230148 RepID=A0A4Z2ES56_9TELE|nr:hypothetical protein EYF80_058228 [Liparis tanakae]
MRERRLLSGFSDQSGGQRRRRPSGKLKTTAGSDLQPLTNQRIGGVVPLGDDPQLEVFHVALSGTETRSEETKTVRGDKDGQRRQRRSEETKTLRDAQRRRDSELQSFCVITYDRLLVPGVISFTHYDAELLQRQSDHLIG